MIFDAGQPDSAMELKEQERKPPVSAATLSSSFQICVPYFLSLSLSLSVVGKEVEERRDIMWNDVGTRGVTTPAL
jgi:hypothetical protein